MITLDLNHATLLRTETCRVVVDHNAATPLARLIHTGLGENEGMIVSLEGHVDWARDWLNAFLRVNGEDQELRIDHPVKPTDEIEICLRCTRPPLPEELDELIIGQVGLSLGFSFKTETQDGRGSTSDWLDRTLEVSRVVMATNEPILPRVEADFDAETPVLSRALLGRTQSYELGRLRVVQPKGDLEYAGPERLPSLKVMRMVEIDGVRTDVDLMPLHTDSALRSEHRSGGSSRLRLAPGETATLALVLDPAKLLQAAAGRPRVDVRVSWEWWVSPEDTDKRQDPPERFSDHAVASVVCGTDEILEVEWGEVWLVPPMAPGKEPEVVSFTPNRERRFCLEDGPLSFDVSVLDNSWTSLEVRAWMERSGTAGHAGHAHVILADGPLSSTTSVELPLPELARQAGFTEPGTAMTLQLALRVGRDGESAAGRVAVPLRLDDPEPTLRVCLDVGASATSIWFGQTLRFGQNLQMPLGDFIKQVSLDHSEYDPSKRGENYLLPMVVGLSSADHFRSHWDPHSLHALTAVGPHEGAVHTRLERDERRYDVSLPFVPPPREAEVESRLDRLDVISDLKRRVLRGDNMRTTEVLERNPATGSLRPTDRIDPAALMSDVFDELGAYLAPQSLWLSATVGPGMAHDRQSKTMYDRWLDAAPNEIEAIVSHPSNIGEQERRLYEAAGQRFLQRFSGLQPGAQVRAPKLVPEALAAAHFGIEMVRKREQLKLSDGEHVFACIDIGASTFDASLIRATVRGDEDLSWQVLAHFGDAVGGSDLDEALLQLATNALSDHFRKTARRVARRQSHHGYVLRNDLEMRPGLLRAILHDEIQKAKRALTRDLLECLAPAAPYDWQERGPGSALEINLGRILEPHRTRNDGQTQELELERNGALTFVVRANEKTGNTVSLRIKRSLLDARPHEDSDANGGVQHRRLDPQSVVRLLGAAIPAMLARECERLDAPPPLWIVTGRSGLWPPIYAEIQRTVEGMGKGRMASPQPFSPDDMKNAVVKGALALANNPSLPITDGGLKPFAIVRFESMISNDLDGRMIYLIKNADYIDASKSDEKPYKAFSNLVLCRLMPGLHTPGKPGEISRNEIVRLLYRFDCAVVGGPEIRLPSEDLPPAPNGMAREETLAWRRAGRTVHFTVGSRSYSISE